MSLKVRNGGIWRPGTLAASLCLLALGACQPGPETMTLEWDPAAGKLSAFPDDAFTVADSTTRTGRRVVATASSVAAVGKLPPMFQDAYEAVSVLDGFGVSGAISLRFSEELDPAQFPSGLETASFDANLVIAVRTAAGLRPWPYEIQFIDDHGSVLLHPLRPFPPATEVAVLLKEARVGATGSLAVASQAMETALFETGTRSDAGSLERRMRGVLTELVGLGALASEADAAGLFLFTTQSTGTTSYAIQRFLAGRAAPTTEFECVEEEEWKRCEGRLDAIDFRGEDGIIPLVASASEVAAGSTYEVPFTVWLPLADKPVPALLFGHGLGSSRAQAERLVPHAAREGFAVIAMPAVRHGDHPTNVADEPFEQLLDFFGVDIITWRLSPLRMRDHFRQSAYDKLQLLKLVRAGVDVDGDGHVEIDPDGVSYIGVSLGGIMGPQFLALAPEVRAGVLVVPGGTLSRVVTDADVFAPLIQFFRPGGASKADMVRFFAVVQAALDRGDPSSWAGALLSGRPAEAPAAAPNLLVGMVLDDDTVPNSSTLALARALGIPQVPPTLLDVALTESTGPAPIAANLPDGRTAGMLQFDRIGTGDGGFEAATHHNIGDSDVGLRAWMSFLRGHAYRGQPVIVDPYVPATQ